MKTLARISVSVTFMLTILFASGAALVPAVTFASGSGLIPCEGVDDSASSQKSCTFGDLITLVSNLINFMLFVIAPLIAAVLLLYAGILILSSGGNAEKISQAKGIFFDALIGLVIALCAWLVVKTIMVTLGYDTSIFPHFY